MSRASGPGKHCEGWVSPDWEVALALLAFTILARVAVLHMSLHLKPGVSGFVGTGAMPG